MQLPNELVAITSFLVLGALVLAAGKLGKTALFVLSATFIAVSNITVQITVPVFGLTISWAIIVYSMVYLITDILCEYYGKAVAYRLAATNLAVQFILWGYVYLSSFVEPSSTPANESMFEVMRKMFGTSSQVSLAALLASLGPFLDITIFGVIKKWWTNRTLSRAAGRESSWIRLLHVIIRNKLSTLVGQCVNTIVFFTIALLGAELTTQQLVSVIASACLVKIIVAIMDVPLLAFFDTYLRPPQLEPKS